MVAPTDPGRLDDPPVRSPRNGADQAFEMLRDHSQHNGRKLVDVAEAVVESHLLLPRSRAPSNPPQSV